jgi:deoxycytidylate deaminase
MIPRIQKFAEAALQLADAVDSDITHQLCALVVNKNRVLSVGYNSDKTHPIAKTNMQMLHAEMHAVLRCPEGDLRGADVIVARARAGGKAGLAKPCAACEGILRRCGVRRVFYTTNWDDDCSAIEEMRL